MRLFNLSTANEQDLPAKELLRRTVIISVLLSMCILLWREVPNAHGEVSYFIQLELLWAFLAGCILCFAALWFTLWLCSLLVLVSTDKWKAIPITIAVFIVMALLIFFK